MRAITLFVFVAMLTVTSAAQARHVQSWPYERLFKEADVVVIAKARETVATDDQPADMPWKGIVGQNTTFDVVTVLKGTPTAGPLTVLHFKVKDGLISVSSSFVKFKTKQVIITGVEREGWAPVKMKATLGPPHYLLYLKAGQNGRYEPVSGQRDSSFSVKEIYSQLPRAFDTR